MTLVESLLLIASAVCAIALWCGLVYLVYRLRRRYPRRKREFMQTLFYRRELD